MKNHLFFLKKFTYRLTIFTGCFFFFTAGPYSTKSSAETYHSGTLYGSWQKDDHGWWFLRNYNPPYPSSQWGDQNGNLYYFDEEGYMVTGWQYIDAHWYYFNPLEGKNQGALIKGWIHEEGNGSWYYTNQLGIMVTGWHKIDGYWYYFNPLSDGHMGRMVTDQFIDDIYIDISGRMNEPR